MKSQIILLPIVAFLLSGCIADQINSSTQTIHQNRCAIEHSTAHIMENQRIIQQSTETLKENLQLLESANN